MQIGLECFLDEQLSSMIASENRHGDCEIQHKTDCIIYDTEEDHYLEEYLEEIMDAFTVAKHLKVAESDVRADYLKNFLSKWKVFSVTGDDIQQIITAICSDGNNGSVVLTCEGEYTFLDLNLWDLNNMLEEVF
mgnify:CR=1 FL=1